METQYYGLQLTPFALTSCCFGTKEINGTPRGYLILVPKSQLMRGCHVQIGCGERAGGHMKCTHLPFLRRNITVIITKHVL